MGQLHNLFPGLVNLDSLSFADGGDFKLYLDFQILSDTFQPWECQLKNKVKGSRFVPRDGRTPEMEVDCKDRTTKNTFTFPVIYSYFHPTLSALERKNTVAIVNYHRM